MITLSVCYSQKSGTEFASATIGGMEFHPEILDDPTAFRDSVRRAYELCSSSVETQLGISGASEPAAPPWNPATLPPPRPSAPPPVNNNFGPPKTGRSFNGWLSRQDAATANRAAELAKEWRKPWKFLEWTDPDIVHLYRTLTGEPNGSH